MQIRPIVRAAGAAALALVVSQCSGGGDTGAQNASAASRRVEACELVTKDEAGTLLGTSVTDAKGDFKEQTYVKPTNYTASCMYTGDRVAVLLVVEYPRVQTRRTSEELAARITEQLRSSPETDPSLREVYQTTEIRPVRGLAGPAAEYTMFDQTTLEAQAGQYWLKVVAPTSESARGVAAKALERLQ